MYDVPSPRNIILSVWHVQQQKPCKWWRVRVCRKTSLNISLPAWMEKLIATHQVPHYIPYYCYRYYWLEEKIWGIYVSALTHQVRSLVAAT